MFERVKIKNIKNILLYLLSNTTATKPKIVRATELSNSTVSDTVNAMCQLGFLLADGEDTSIGGRRSVIYRLNRDFGCFLGVQIEQDGVSICRTDPCGALLDYFHQPWTPDVPPLEQLYALLEKICADPACGKVLGIGLGVPGSVNHPAQRILHCALPGWDDLPLTALVRDRLGVCCVMDHTVNGQIALHKVFGGARDTDDFAVICEASPTKLALCLDGKTCRGMHNLCGESETFSALCAAAQAAAPLLDLNRLLCGWRTGQGQDALADLGAGLPSPTVELYEAKESDLALGMALLGEIQWFENVYYLM